MFGMPVFVIKDPVDEKTELVEEKTELFCRSVIFQKDNFVRWKSAAVRVCSVFYSVATSFGRNDKFTIVTILIFCGVTNGQI